jgi:hypothetical protein
MRKTVKYIRQDCGCLCRDSNPTISERKSEALPLGLTCLVFRHEVINVHSQFQIRQICHFARVILFHGVGRVLRSGVTRVTNAHNKALRIHGAKRGEVTGFGENYIIFTLHQIR